MSEERLNELFSIVNEGYSSIQEREIRDYITNLQQKVEQLEKDNYDLDKDNQMLFEENQELKEKLDKYENPEDMTLFAMWCTEKVKDDNKQLKDKLSKIETLIINHNCDTGDIYYKYNSKFLKSELKQRILEIVYEERSDSNE